MMKKIIKTVFVLLALVTMSNFSFAQIKFGARAGLNLANVAGVNTNTQSKAGLHLGVYSRLGSGKVAFQPELLFSMKGYASSSGSYKSSQTLNYIDIPLMLRLGGKFGVFLGAQPSFLLSARYKTKNGSSVTKDSNKDLYKSFDMAAVTGLEYELESGLNFGARLGVGLIPIFESSAYKKVVNFNFKFTVGYTIGK